MHNEASVVRLTCYEALHCIKIDILNFHTHISEDGGPPPP